MTHKLPKLPYDFSALEPHIDTRTMAVHHDKHHQAYVDNLNKVLEGYEDLQKMTVVELLRNLDEIPEEIRTAVRNNGGGHANHSMFWPSLSPKGGELKGSLAEDIDSTFGSFENFKEQFTTAAMTRFGSGWTWLCVDGEGGLVVTSTPNQDNPISTGLIPILGLDVWEHAYYLKYENRRGDYIAAWWNIVNWQEALSNYASVRIAAGFDQVSQWVKSTWNKFEEGWAKLGKDE
jgi:Fe-Mn family superoxide dismutase